MSFRHLSNEAPQAIHTRMKTTKPARDRKVRYSFTFFQNICSFSLREDRSNVKAVAFSRSVLSTSSSNFSPRSRTISMFLTI